MTVFDWVNNILVHKKHWDDFTEDEQKKFSPFIINRFLSMDKEFIEVVNMFQKYAIGVLEPREVYKWYCEVQKYFECSKLQVKQNLELISKDELIEILNKYGLEKKKIKRIIK